MAFAYATLVQLASEAKLAVTGFTASTNPPATKAQEILDEECAAVDAKLSLKYVLPLVQTDSQLIIRTIVLAIAAARVRLIMGVTTNAADVGSQNGQAPKTPEQLAMIKLQAIVGGQTPLIGEQLKTAGDGVKSWASSNGQKAYFKRGTPQW